MATLLLFASIKDAAGGTASIDIPAATVGELIDSASRKFGDGFTNQIQACRIWLNGEPTNPTECIVDKDEVALLPPVSGGQQPIC